ncbi:mercury resistance system periplasmic binding protein MerP [Halomonas elongata]|uniref:mercury resistance system periplasmic binding protein MerP n=1 Tax=Halomonas elongata TaxID=2746 RepID=UPI0023B00899|nr:mercury resistance system periplasmic binding protein MerP [Halomonas elongata]
MIRRLVLTSFIVLLSVPAWGAMQTVTLLVPDMTCAACLVTIRTALNKVEGVSRVAVNYPDREAVVTFDDSRTTVKALTEATTNAGYPSTLEANRE